jgi:hypothetical protein
VVLILSVTIDSLPMPQSDENPRTEMEGEGLRFVCQGSGKGGLNHKVRMALRPCRWQDPLHQVMFQVLCDLPAESPALIREQLPARLTRHGFPDVAWETYFEPPGLAQKELERLVRRLADST